MYKKDYCCCTGTVHCRYCIKAGKPAHLTIDDEYNTVLFVAKQESINELERNNIMNNALRTQSDAINAIKLGSYLVMSVSINGDFSMAASPTPQTTASAARVECQRLSRINPGKLFTFVKLCGAEMLPVNTISI